MKRPQVLVIEDDADTAELIAEVLSDEGFQVAVSRNGFDGLSALGARPDIVLCDIDLPDVSGFQVLERIRSGKLLPALVPFIFVTAFSQRDHQMSARKLGCDDYVTKPIDFELLVAILRHRLSVATENRLAGTTVIHLTDREREALTWSARGKSSCEIAEILRISERTVNFHVDNAMRKLGAASRIQAAVKSALLGLIEP
jgi:DNA-binding NarL/FixJ family response regulator